MESSLEGVRLIIFRRCFRLDVHRMLNDLSEFWCVLENYLSTSLA